MHQDRYLNRLLTCSASLVVSAVGSSTQAAYSIQPYDKDLGVLPLFLFLFLES